MLKNFSFDQATGGSMFGSGAPGFSFGTPSTTSSTGTPGGFSFGNPSASSTPGLSLGATSQATPSVTPGFSFGGGASTAATGTPAAGGFSFGGSQTTGSATSGFKLGGTTQPAATAGFSLGGITQPTGGTTQPTGTTGFSLGGITQPTGGTTQPTGTAGFSLGGITQPTGATTQPTGGITGFSLGGTASGGAGFNLGGITQTATPATSNFTLGGATQPGGGATTQPSTGLNLGGGAGTTTGTIGGGGFSFGNTPTVTAAATSAPSAGFSLGTPQSTTTAGSAGFGFGQKTTAAAVAPSGGFNFATPAASTATTSTGIKLGGIATTTAATANATQSGSVQPPGSTTAGIGFNLAPKTTGGITLTTSTAAPKVGFGLGGTSTAASTASGLPGAVAAAGPQKQMTYQQLEDNINKWMADLEKQEKDFLEQATQVNAWDRVLIENGEKITSLNNDMERVKIDQQKLDHELDFIKSQQRELEDLLMPLERAVDQQPNISFQQHTDLERENTYQLAENVDAQLKRMVQDLKEIISHLNTSNTNQDQNDPVQQITKILNAHMDSLQWIDQNTALVSRRVEDISKQMELQRKEQEQNFRLVYN